MNVISLLNLLFNGNEKRYDGGTMDGEYNRMAHSIHPSRITVLRKLIFSRGLFPLRELHFLRSFLPPVHSCPSSNPFFRSFRGLKIRRRDLSPATRAFVKMIYEPRSYVNVNDRRNGWRFRLISYVSNPCGDGEKK